MNPPDFAELDQQFVWHPFTQMRDWLRREPTVIVSGQGAVLRDARGREYLDANASIWTNLHGHNHPRLNAAIARQLGKISHSSALGLANEPASLLAAKLVEIAHRQLPIANGKSALRKSGNRQFAKCFFSDNGSTALEVALKLAYEFTRRTRGPRPAPRFLALEGAYHGDTIGAVSLGHIALFHQAYSGLLFKTDAVMAPYCYRCPFNRAQPERADARLTRRCRWECVVKVEQKFAAAKRRGGAYSGFVFEPLLQGAAGMIPQPAGWLARVAEIARGHGALLIADEVMTGFGRCGAAEAEIRNPKSEIRKKSEVRNSKIPLQNPVGADVRRLKPNGDQSLLTSAPTALKEPPESETSAFGSALPLFACQHEAVVPDFLCLAKGLTGGYLPMAATLTTQTIFDAFLGEYEEFKTFFHGHSFTGNQLGSAAALASLKLLASTASQTARRRLQAGLREELASLWSLPHVGDIRQVGLVAGVELVRDWRTREPFDLRERAGIRVCEAMAQRGVLTRPIGNVIALLPPYCTSAAQLRQMVTALREAVEEVLK